MVTLFPSARIDGIYASKSYILALESIEEAEKDRKFCRHNLAHFLDVARIMSIMNAEYGAFCAADEIYACALVHDIGRARGGRNHALSSAEFAKELLPSCGFLPEETERIASAVSAHGGRGGAEVCPAPGAGEEDKIKAALEKAENPLGTLLVIADKLSRNCFNCAAEEECYWEKKNGRIWI